MRSSCLGLPLDIWRRIFLYLSYQEMQQLMLVGRQLKEYVLPFLYEEVYFSEWAGSGLRLAVAIQQGKLSPESVGYIRKIAVIFTSYPEILATLELLQAIQWRLTGLDCVSIRSHQTEDCYRAIGLLTANYMPDSIELEARVCGPISALLDIPDITLCEHITRLHVPLVLKSSLAKLSRLDDLAVIRVIDNTRVQCNPHQRSVEPSPSKQFRSGSPSPFVFRNRVPKRLHMCYSDWVALGEPPVSELDLELFGEMSHYHIQNPALEELRLVAHKDWPNISISLHTPSLRILILCNISMNPTMELLEESESSLSQLEFLSIAPVTVPVLQTIALHAQLPSMRLLIALVLHTSFQSEVQQDSEVQNFVEWLQIVAATYPVDLLDFTRRVKKNIYFSEGLWCRASQGPYRKYLSLVSPPSRLQ